MGTLAGQQTGRPDLADLILTGGSHESRSAGLCLLEAAAWWAGLEHTDEPPCCPVVRAFGSAWNDALDDVNRQRLVPFVPRLGGTAGDGHTEARAWLATDWLCRVYALEWLRAASGSPPRRIALHDAADALEQCAPILTAEAARAAQPALDRARKEGAAAWSVMRAAARAAARHATAAAVGEWDAAARAARDIAWAATASAAGAAAAAAVGEWDAAAARAARAAAVDALHAARTIAWAAAAAVATRDAARLRPTTEALIESAFELYERMIALGEDRRAA